jgi:hypothetical protein
VPPVPAPRMTIFFMIRTDLIQNKTSTNVDIIL